jgi:hypothetical protein
MQPLKHSAGTVVMPTVHFLSSLKSLKQDSGSLLIYGAINSTNCDWIMLFGILLIVVLLNLIFGKSFNGASCFTI